MPSATAKRKSKAKHSDIEEDSDISLSDPSLLFEPKPNDEEELWSVEEILGEKSKQYKVRWEGNDPATGKRWPDSWVDKTNVTDDLVITWKKKKKAKEKKSMEAKEKKKSARASTSSRARASFASTSRNTRSGSTATASGTAKREQSTVSNNSRATRSTRTATPLKMSLTKRPSTAAAAKKPSRAHMSDDSEDPSEDEADEKGEDEDEDLAPNRSVKKVKSVSAARASKPSQANGKKRKLSQTDFRSVGRTSTSKGQNTKYRQAALDSEDEAAIVVRPTMSRSSTSEQEDYRLFGGEGDREEPLDKVKDFVSVFTGTSSGNGRPTKRRRVKRGKANYEDLKEEEEEEEAQEDDFDLKEGYVKVDRPLQSPTLQDTQESFEPRKVGPRKLFLDDDEESGGNDEEEERLVQETLSDGFASPGPENLQREEPPRSRPQSKEPSPSGTSPQFELDDGEAHDDEYMHDNADGPLDMYSNHPPDPDIPSNKATKKTIPFIHNSISTAKKNSGKANASDNFTSPASKSNAKPVKPRASSDSDVEIISITRIGIPEAASSSKTGTVASHVKASSKHRPSLPERIGSSSSSTVEVKIGPPGKRSLGHIPIAHPKLKKALSTKSESEEEEEDEPSKQPILQIAKRSLKTSAKANAQEPVPTTRPNQLKVKKSEKIAETSQGTSIKQTASIKKPEIFASAKPPTGLIPSRFDELENEPSGSKPRSSTKFNSTVPEEEGSDTDRGPPPLEWEVGSPTKKLPQNLDVDRSVLEKLVFKEPIREKSVVYDGMDVDEPGVEPLSRLKTLDPLDENEMTDEVLRERLSPGARKRLRKFEIDVLCLVVDKDATSVAKKAKKDKKKEKAKAKAAAAVVAQAAGQPPAPLLPTKSHQHQPQHSYMTDIVPETEVEESQSQEKELHISQSLPAPSSPPTVQSTTKHLGVPETPNKLSLKSRMKPRTPGSKTGSITEMSFAALGSGQPNLFGPFNTDLALQIPSSYSGFSILVIS
ncbi:hypothetical protein CPB83DRAFT_105283 [Crepidotus variabilis]|uniref:Chromo domain-containing protein n=1 Tax=Crepidotus variabilis TaxID=179855 RepID=A0A9P6EM98_9AGAR|nr:hypothetical protein CPB83DRAFT_105283 [Crepidotus variabilis]